MDEILASIRRIIESGEERQAALPQRRSSDFADEAPTVLLTAANQPNGRYQSPAPESEPFAERLAPQARTASPRPVEDRAVEDRAAADLAAALRRPASEHVEASVSDAPVERSEPAAEAPRRRFESPADVLSRLRTVSRGETQAEPTRSYADEIPGVFTPQVSDSAREVEPVDPIVEAPCDHDRLDPAQFNGEFDEQEFTVELLATAGLIRGASTESLRAAVEASEPPLDWAQHDMPAIGREAENADGTGAGLETVAQEPAGKPLLSLAIGEQIAASFEDLARVVREEQLAKMDDTVHQMLRPMLQEWLDDNLPGIVERLVREEIERVARGPRR